MKTTRKSAYPDPIARVVLTLTRQEGPAEECGIPRTFTTFQDAEACIRAWARTAPEADICDKTSVALLIESGPLDGTRGPLETYEATFRLELRPAGVHDLRAWLEARAGYLAGQRRPPTLTPGQYADVLARAIRDPALLPRKLACEALYARLAFLGSLRREVVTNDEGRIPRCKSAHVGACDPYRENPSGLWRCPGCRRLFCLREGGSDSPVCDTCWEDPEKRAIRTPRWAAEGRE